jgi:hypothetical protein
MIFCPLGRLGFFQYLIDSISRLNDTIRKITNIIISMYSLVKMTPVGNDKDSNFSPSNQTQALLDTRYRARSLAIAALQLTGL